MWMYDQFPMLLTWLNLKGNLLNSSFMKMELLSQTTKNWQFGRLCSFIHYLLISFKNELSIQDLLIMAQGRTLRLCSCERWVQDPAPPCSPSSLPFNSISDVSCWQSETRVTAFCRTGPSLLLSQGVWVPFRLSFKEKIGGPNRKVSAIRKQVECKDSGERLLMSLILKAKPLTRQWGKKVAFCGKRWRGKVQAGKRNGGNGAANWTAAGRTWEFWEFEVHFFIIVGGRFSQQGVSTRAPPFGAEDDDSFLQRLFEDAPEGVSSEVATSLPSILLFCEL